MSSTPDHHPQKNRRVPGHQAIARRAHALWEQRGRPEGESVAHWLAAEAEFRAAAGERAQEPREVDDDTPITLDASTPPRSRDDRADGDGQLPPPHTR